MNSASASHRALLALRFRQGNQVLVEKGAGLGSGFEDAEYLANGASILDHPADVWNQAEMIIKVKEPLESEYQYFRKGLLIFTYFHLAADPALTKALLDSGATAMAYETITDANGSLPCLYCMSEIAAAWPRWKAPSTLKKPMADAA